MIDVDRRRNGKSANLGRSGIDESTQRDSAMHTSFSKSLPLRLPLTIT
jgi:hypothetical protein